MYFGNNNSRVPHDSSMPRRVKKIISKELDRVEKAFRESILALLKELNDGKRKIENK